MKGFDVEEGLQQAGLRMGRLSDGNILNKPGFCVTMTWIPIPLSVSLRVRHKLLSISFPTEKN